jgi:hypothetical protein
MTTTTTTTGEALGLRRPEVLGLIDHSGLDPETAEALAALVPSPLLGPDPDGVSGYVTRDVDGVRDMDVLSHAMDLRVNVLLSGPTGSAKSSAARAFAAAWGLPFVRVPVNGALDPSSLWGKVTGIRPDGGVEYTNSPGGLVLRHGGVIVFDEVNMTHARVLAAFHGLLDVFRSVSIPENAGEIVQAHPALLVVGTMNPGYEGTARLNTALARRFAWTISWGYSSAVEEVLVPSESLRDFAASVRELPEVRTDLSTDSLVSFVETALVLGIDFAAGRLVSVFSEAERGGVVRALELRLPTIAHELGLTSPEEVSHV